MSIQVKIENNVHEVGQAVAKMVAAKINAFIPTSQKPYFVLGLPTGSTPIPTYHELIKMYQSGFLSFKSVVTFNMDEYVGLEASHPQSYHFFMNENLFNHIDIDPENIHILNGTAKELQKECADYEEKIALHGGIDLQLGGIGENGHLAFNEPYTSRTSKTHLQTLADETIQVNSRFFDKIEDVPTQALTVGLGTLMATKEIIIIATGAKKANAVQESVFGPSDESVPASLLQQHPNAIFVCDTAAAEKL